MPKVDFEKPLLTIHGKQMTHVVGEDEHGRPKAEPVVLKFPVIEALLADGEINKNLTRNAKMERWVLAKKIRDGGVQELSVEELALARDAVAQNYGTAVVGACLDALNGD